VTGARLLCFDLPACSSLRWHNIDFGLSTPTEAPKGLTAKHMDYGSRNMDFRFWV
jgi:hypothetical protein